IPNLADDAEVLVDQKADGPRQERTFGGPLPPNDGTGLSGQAVVLASLDLVVSVIDVVDQHEVRLHIGDAFPGIERLQVLLDLLEPWMGADDVYLRHAAERGPQIVAQAVLHLLLENVSKSAVIAEAQHDLKTIWPAHVRAGLG